MGDGVSDLDLGGALDAGDDISHISASHLFARDELHLEVTDFLHLVFHPGGEELHLVPLADTAVLDFKICYDPAERVENRVEDQGLEWGLRVALRRGDLLHYGIQDRGDAFSGACGNLEHILRVAADQFADLVGDEFHLGRLHVYLVEHRDDFKPVVDGHVKVGDGLCLHALRGVHHKQSPLAGGDGA